MLLALMGSPDDRQIDGLGGAHPLTSKVAIVSPSAHPDADVDYLFLQVVVDRPEVSDAQNCGNILAGVGAFAIQQGLITATESVTRVRVHMLNSGGVAVLEIPTPDGQVEFDGDTQISGVPGTAAAVPIEFLNVAGSSCGALLPTGNVLDVVEGIEVTCIDAGMPVVLMRAADLGKTGNESPAELEADAALCETVESIRLISGELMNLGDVSSKTVPKMSLISPALNGGMVNTRTFIPKRVHDAVGVLGAVSVAAACKLSESVTATVVPESTRDSECCDIEHPTGYFSVEVVLDEGADGVAVSRSALIRTARLLMTGTAQVPTSVWSGPA